jgi:hypothetical protein
MSVKAPGRWSFSKWFLAQEDMCYTLRYVHIVFLECCASLATRFTLSLTSHYACKYNPPPEISLSLFYKFKSSGNYTYHLL